MLKIAFAMVALSLVACTEETTAKESAGVVPASAGIAIHPAAALAPTGGGQTNAPVFDGQMWAIGTSTLPLRYPIPVRLGDSITRARLFVVRSEPGASLTVAIQRLDNATGDHLLVGYPVVDASTTPGRFAISVDLAGPETVAGDATYSLLVLGGGVAGDHVDSAMVGLL